MPENSQKRITELLNKLINLISIYDFIQEEFQVQNKTILANIEPQLNNNKTFQALFRTVQMGASLKGGSFDYVKFTPYRISKDNINKIRKILLAITETPDINLPTAMKAINIILITDPNMLNSENYINAVEMIFNLKNAVKFDDDVWLKLNQLFVNYAQGEDLFMTLKSLVENLISITENGREALYKIEFPLKGDIKIQTIATKINAGFRKEKVMFDEHRIKHKSIQYKFLEKLLIYEGDFVPYSNFLDDKVSAKIELEKIKRNAFYAKSNLLRHIKYSLSIYFEDNKAYLNNCYKNLFDKENLNTLYTIEGFKLFFPDDIFEKKAENKCLVIRNTQYDNITV